jgi:hypothetical protein
VLHYLIQAPTTAQLKTISLEIPKILEPDLVLKTRRTYNPTLKDYKA